MPSIYMNAKQLSFVLFQPLREFYQFFPSCRLIQIQNLVDVVSTHIVFSSKVSSSEVDISFGKWDIDVGLLELRHKWDVSIIYKEMWEMMLYSLHSSMSAIVDW